MAKVKVYVMPRSGIGHIDEFHTDDTHNGEELYHLLQQRFGDGGLWNPKGKPVPSQSMRKMDFGVYKYYLCTAGTKPEIARILEGLQVLSVVWLHVCNFQAVYPSFAALAATVMVREALTSWLVQVQGSCY